MTDALIPSQDELESVLESESQRDYEARVLSTPVEWNLLLNSGDINEEELGLLLDYDSQHTQEEKLDILAECGQVYIALYCRLLKQIQNADVISYMLTVIYDFLSAEPQLAKQFVDLYLYSPEQADLFNCFFHILARESSEFAYEKGKSCQILAVILSQANAPAEPVRTFMDWLVQSLSRETNQLSNYGNVLTDTQRQDSNSQLLSTTASAPATAHQTQNDIITQSLLPVLYSLKQMLKTKQQLQGYTSPQQLTPGETKSEDAKQEPAEHPAVLFVKSGGFAQLALLLKHPKASKNSQVLYVTIFCVWILSFHKQLLLHLKGSNICNILTNLLTKTNHRKVVRIIFTLFAHLLAEIVQEQDELKHEGKEDFHNQLKGFAEDLIGHQLHRIVESMLKKKWKDGDMVKDMEFVLDHLTTVLKKLSSFEVYVTEIMSGELTRSPVHSELFWAENFREFEENNFHLIEKLISFLDSKDDVTTEMGCFDLGEFARFHPDGRRVIRRKGGKDMLISLMNHPNIKVSKQALLAVQKIMVENWQYLQKSSTSGGITGLKKGLSAR